MGWVGSGWTLPALVRQTHGRSGPLEAVQPSMKSQRTWGPAPRQLHGAVPPTASGAQPHGGCREPCPHRLPGPSPTAVARGPAPNGFRGPAPRRLHVALPPSASGAQPHGGRTGTCPNGFWGPAPRRLHGPCPQRLLGPSPTAVAWGPAPNGFWGPAPRRSHGGCTGMGGGGGQEER